MAEHRIERAALHAALRTPHDGPTVVVTHHPASPLAADRFRDAPGVPWWVPAFYARPESLEAMIDHTLGRVLDLYDIDVGTVRRWTGDKARPKVSTPR